MAQRSAESMLPRPSHQRALLQLEEREHKTHLWARKDHMLAGGATTRLEILAGHHKAHSQDKAVNGSVLQAGGEYGVSSYKRNEGAVFICDTGERI
jgi:hypothetical protein